MQRLDIEIIGRENELASLNGLLDVIESRSATLLLEGEIGIGKSSLWRAGVVEATDRSYRVLGSRPVEAEAKLPFAALGDLFADVPDEVIASLPEPQERALMVALLRSAAEGPHFHQRAVGLGTLGALRFLAAESPVLVAIDDVQWLDPPSARVLEFALRRLEDERVGTLAAQRTGTSRTAELNLERTVPPDRLKKLEIAPLTVDAIDHLLRERLDTPVFRPDLQKLQEVSGGNPYFALEFGRALAQADVGAANDAIPVPESLRDLARDRLERLPEDVREYALFVSALPHPTVELVKAALHPRTGEAQLATATGAGVLELDHGTIRFTHPLLASVLYSESSVQRRREIHQRLAEILADTEERARHMALSADQPDAAVATALEQAAQLARARGAPEAAAELAEQSCRLTPPELGDDRVRRLVRTADYHDESGNSVRGRALLEEALAGSSPGLGRARVLIPLAWSVITDEGYRQAAPLFREALAEAGGEPGIQIEAERGQAWCEQHDGDLATASVHARAAVEAAERLDDPAQLGSALADLAFLEFLMGHGLPNDLIERAVRLEEKVTARLGIMGRPSWIKGMLLQWAGELDASRAILEDLRQRATEAGDEHSLPFVLNSLGRVDLFAGNWPQALQNAEDAHAATLQTGQEMERMFALSTQGLVSAHFGLVDAARQDAEEVLDIASRLHSKPARFEAFHILGFLELSAGQLDDASLYFDRLSREVPETGFAEPGLDFRYQADDIETLVGLGRLDQAQQRLEVFEEQAQRLERPWALATAARCRGLLLAATGDVTEALDALDHSLEEHRRLGEPFERGRTLFVQGMIARRDKKKGPARRALDEALEIFTDLGAALWIERAEAELQRVSGRASSDSDLTPTEQQIAQLVAEGQSNREVADALFVSPKTVEWNLTKIYRKLGVRSRGQLTSKFQRADD